MGQNIHLKANNNYDLLMNDMKKINEEEPDYKKSGERIYRSGDRKTNKQKHEENENDKKKVEKRQESHPSSLFVSFRLSSLSF